jgi:hypothetical protein
MKDDWNLKGLKQKLVDYIDKSIDSPYEIYTKNTIDTLREKIMRDIKEIETEYNKWHEYPSPDMIIDDITKAINKRFGVE